MNGKHILIVVLLFFLTVSCGAIAQDEPASPAGASAQEKPVNVLLYFGLYTQWYGIDKALEPVKGHALRTVNAKNDGADFIPDEKDLSAVDVVVLSDVNHGSIKDSGLAAIDSFVKRGGGLLVLGGPFTYGEGKYSDSIFPQMLPIEKPERFDLKWEKAGLPFSTATEHEILKDVDLSAKPHVYWIHEARSKHGTTPVLEAGRMPLLVLGQYGKGRVAAFLGTPMGEAPEGQTPFWQWQDWDKLMRNTLVWLAAGKPPAEKKILVYSEDFEKAKPGKTLGDLGWQVHDGAGALFEVTPDHNLRIIHSSVGFSPDRIVYPVNRKRYSGAESQGK